VGCGAAAAVVALGPVPSDASDTSMVPAFGVALGASRVTAVDAD
jgi:hypothetical protein